MGRFLRYLAFFLFVCAASVVVMNSFIEGMPSWKVAAFVVGVIALTVIVAASVTGAGLWFFNRTLQTNRDAYRRDDQPDGELQAMRDIIARLNQRGGSRAYIPPAALFEAQRINVPRMLTAGNVIPMGMPPPILTTSVDGEEVEVPLNVLERFCAMDRPTRSLWVGKATAYGDALNFCKVHNIVREKGAGFVWRPEYPRERRKAWVAQWSASSPGGEVVDDE